MSPRPSTAKTSSNGSKPAARAGTKKAGAKTTGAKKTVARPTSEATDRRALELRAGGKTFRAIARELGLDGVRGANAAYNRGLRLQTKRKQQELRGKERARLDASWEKSQRDEALSSAELERRRRGVEWHRTQLDAD